MSEQPRELSETIRACAHVGEIQAAFDAYQRASFPSRGANFFALELAGEVGELANLEKKLWKGQERLRTGEPIVGFPIEDEAADVFIALMNYCNARGVGLAAAVQRKLAVIEERRTAG